MDYYKDLKVEDFDCYQTYWLGRVLKVLKAGYTYQQCQQHRLFDIGLQAGLTPEQLLSLCLCFKVIITLHAKHTPCLLLAPWS